jgi:MFS family permease
VSFVGDLRTVARSRDFRKLLAVRLSSQLTDGVLQVALASYVFFSPERQATAPEAAAAFAVLLLPYSIVGPFAGVLLDRWSRRQVLVFANLTRVVLAAAIAGLVAGNVTGPTFYVTVLACLSVNRFLLAGLSAALPHTVPREELVMANAVSPTCGTLSFLGGLGLGYAIRAALPGAADRSADATVLAIAAVGYLVAALLAVRMARDLLGPDYDPARPAVRAAARHVVGGLVDGARHVYHRPAATAALAAIGVQRIGYAVTTIAAILLYRNYFNDPADVDAGLAGLGMGVAAAGVGFALAAVLTPLGVARFGKRHWIVGTLIAAAALQIVPTALYTEPAIVTAALLIGLSAQSLKISVDTVVQEEIDDAYRGRVFSFYDVLFNAAFVAAAALAALMLPPSGRSYVVLIGTALLYGLAAYGYARATRPPAVAERPATVPGIACDA